MAIAITHKTTTSPPIWLERGTARPPIAGIPPTYDPVNSGCGAEPVVVVPGDQKIDVRQFATIPTLSSADRPTVRRRSVAHQVTQYVLLRNAVRLCVVERNGEL